MKSKIQLFPTKTTHTIVTQTLSNHIQLCSRVFPSGRSIVRTDHEIEDQALFVVVDSRTAADVDAVLIPIGRASKETAAVVFQMVELAGLGDTETSLGRALSDGGTVRLGVLQGAGAVDVDLLTARDDDLEIESVLATGEKSGSCVGALDVGLRRAVGGSLLVQPEVTAVGIDCGVLDVGTRVDGKALVGVLWCRSREGGAGKGDDSSGDSGGLHGGGSWWFG